MAMRAQPYRNRIYATPRATWVRISPAIDCSACSPPPLLMSSSNQVTRNFIKIFNAASAEYQNVTGLHLDTHSLATLLDTCHSPEDVSNLLQTQAQAFSKFRDGVKKLMAWLDPTVHILYMFSSTLGEGAGLVGCFKLFTLYDGSQISCSQPFSPARPIFTGIGVLLGVSLSSYSPSCIGITSNSQAVKDEISSYEMLIDLFERIHFFLQRLESYTGMPLTDNMTNLLGKIMAQLLSVLALSTRVMTDSRIREFILCCGISGSLWHRIVCEEVGRKKRY